MEIVILVGLILGIPVMAYLFGYVILRTVFAEPKKPRKEAKIDKFYDADWNPLEEMLKPKTIESKEIGVKEIMAYLERIAGSLDGWRHNGYSRWRHSSGIVLQAEICNIGWMEFKGKPVTFLKCEQINKIARTFTALVRDKEKQDQQIIENQHLNEFIQAIKDKV